MQFSIYNFQQNPLYYALMFLWSCFGKWKKREQRIIWWCVEKFLCRLFFPKKCVRWKKLGNRRFPP